MEECILIRKYKKKLVEKHRQWKTGQWIMFHRPGGDVVRAKLSWVSPITGRYLFVNQAGGKALERTPAELAMDLIGERLELLQDEEMFSRAMSAVASRLRMDVAATARS